VHATLSDHAPVVAVDALALARRGDDLAFARLTDPYRRELQLHCYRILGSVQDAEDAVQDTLLAAWRSLDRFEARSSLRTWLYRIATNRCLNALRDGSRRPRTVPAEHEPSWLEPYPDALLEGVAESPDARYEAKEAVSLAFVTALARLPPRQRAVLVLRDVLDFRAPEVAEMLEATEASVNSALMRARSTLDRARPRDRERAPLPRSARERELVGRFLDAFERDDIDGVVGLLTEDASLTMPPQAQRFQGHAAIAAFLREKVRARRVPGVRLVPTRANGQPGFAYYTREEESGQWEAGGVFVLTLAGERVVALTRFGLGAVSLADFGLPAAFA
jgi:RNA polymerase sigma-70 factor (ECF subfamily)